MTTETTVLQVKGMSCGGCVKSVTNVLLALPGVVGAEVSLERADATVTHDAATVGREQLARAIEEAGFDAR